MSNNRPTVAELEDILKRDPRAITVMVNPDGSISAVPVEKEMVKMDSYEQWTRSEIARLRAEAEKASTDADTLQRTFDKWLESRGRNDETPVPLPTVEQQMADARRLLWGAHDFTSGKRCQCGVTLVEIEDGMRPKDFCTRHYGHEVVQWP